MSLRLYVEENDNILELTNLSTRLEALLVDQNGREMCRAAGIVSRNGPCATCKIPTDEWVLMLPGDKAAYWYENCLRMRLKPSDSYTLTLRIRAVDPKTPKINLIPALEGGQSELP
jgi:hypothetical protein